MNISIDIHMVNMNISIDIHMLSRGNNSEALKRKPVFLLASQTHNVTTPHLQRSASVYNAPVTINDSAYTISVVENNGSVLGVAFRGLFQISDAAFTYT